MVTCLIGPCTGLLGPIDSIDTAESAGCNWRRSGTGPTSAADLLCVRSFPNVENVLWGGVMAVGVDFQAAGTLNLPAVGLGVADSLIFSAN